MKEQICPHCGFLNRGEARFCQQCGQQMDQAGKAADEAHSVEERGDLLSDLMDELTEATRDLTTFFQSVGDSLFGGGKKTSRKKSARRKTSRTQSAPSQPPASAPIRSAPRSRPTAPTQLLSPALSPKAPGETIGGYVILAVWPLQRSNYYRVRWERCPQGHDNPGTAILGQDPPRCQVCQAELGQFLVRETEMPTAVGDEQKRRTLVQLSQSGVPGFLRHSSIFDQGGRRYAVCEYPGDGWQSFSQLSLPVTEWNKVVHWCWSLGNALMRLSEQGFVPTCTVAPRAVIAEYIEPVVLSEYRPPGFADLTMFGLGEAPPQAVQGQMITYLAQVLYTLTSGKLQSLRRAPPDFSDMPAPFRGLVSRVMQNGFDQLGGFLEALRTVLQVPESARSLRQIAGYRSDPGRRRSHNEDFVGKYSLGMQQTPDASEVGLYLVADGMGGHQAGELASRDVVRVILDEIQEKVQELQVAPKLKRSTIQLGKATTPGEILKGAVLRANEVLFNARRQRGSDRGTTLTAALVVGDACAVANVGDSRTYLWRQGQLTQVTQDHSLVAGMVAAQMIQPEEVRVHPQRSQIYRNLGERSTVEVDIYEQVLQAGDRLLLCSDGLWEMVLDAEIAKMMLQSANPQEACDRLVEAANLAGGEDNISVIVVWMT